MSKISIIIAKKQSSITLYYPDMLSVLHTYCRYFTRNTSSIKPWKIQTGKRWDTKISLQSVHVILQKAPVGLKQYLHITVKNKAHNLSGCWVTLIWRHQLLSKSANQYEIWLNTKFLSNLSQNHRNTKGNIIMQLKWLMCGTWKLHPVISMENYIRLV